MSTIPVAALPSLVERLYKGLYFGTVLSIALYGITCMQTFFYYVHYQNDPIRTKIFVAVMWAVNTVHEALIISGVYKYFISGIVNPASILVWNPEMALGLLLTAIVAVPVQGFFVHRVYVFASGKKKMIAPLLWFPLAVVQLGSGIMYTTKGYYIENGAIQVVELAVLSDYEFTVIVTVCLSASAAADILIAILLTIMLIRERGHAPKVGRTSHMLQRLVIFAVNTGIWTAVFAFLTLVLVQVSSTNTAYAVPAIPICSVYCNTLLANLNARAYIASIGRQTLPADDTIDIQFSATSDSRLSQKHTDF